MVVVVEVVAFEQLKVNCAARLIAATTKCLDSEGEHPAHPLAMKIFFGSQGRSGMSSKLVFRGGEVELVVVHVAAALEPPSGFAFIRNKAIETCAQKRLKAGLAGVVSGEMVFLECV